MANTTLAKLRIKGKKEMKLDRIGRVWDDEEWNDAINEGLLEISSRGDFKWKEQEKNITLSSVIDQQEYDLDTLITDFEGVDLVEFDGEELDSTTFEQIKENYRTIPSGTPTQYYIYQNKLGLVPIPKTVDDIFVLYRGFNNQLTQESDESPFGTDFDRAIITYACYALLTKPGDTKNTNRAAIKKQRFEEIIARLFKIYLVRDKNQLKFKTTYTPRSRRYISKRNLTSKL